MRDSGIVLDERPYIGSVTPPLSFEDRSRWKNNGAFVNHTIWVQQPSRLWAMSFDGGDDWVNCGNAASLQITGAMTLETWARQDAAQHCDLITKFEVPNNRAFYIWILASGRIRFLISVDGIAVSYFDTTNTLALETFNHIMAIFNPGTIMDVYVNGLFWERYSGAIPNSIYNSTGNLKIGYIHAGLMTGVRIYIYALTAQQIRKRFEATRAWFGV